MIGMIEDKVRGWMPEGRVGDAGAGEGEGRTAVMKSSWGWMSGKDWVTYRASSSAIRRSVIISSTHLVSRRRVTTGSFLTARCPAFSASLHADSPRSSWRDAVPARPSTCLLQGGALLHRATPSTFPPILASHLPHWDRAPSSHAVRRQQHLQARAAVWRLPGLRRRWHLRARPSAPPLPRVRRLANLHSRPAEDSL